MPTPKTISIPLEGRIEGGESIEFLRLEKAARLDIPFALIRYAIDGREQPLGLRMDLDKCAFLDHFDDRAKDELLGRAAAQIVDLIGDDPRTAGCRRDDESADLAEEIKAFRREVGGPDAQPERDSIPRDIGKRLLEIYLPMAVGRDEVAKWDALASLRDGRSKNRDQGLVDQWAREAVSLAVHVLKPMSIKEIAAEDRPKAIAAIFRFGHWYHTENKLRDRFRPYAQDVVRVLWGGMERW